MAIPILDRTALVHRKQHIQRWLGTGVGLWSCLNVTIVNLTAQTVAPITPNHMICTPSVFNRQTAGLKVFAGSYTLKQATAADSTDTLALVGFSTIGIPNHIGAPGAASYATGNHGNFAWGDAPRWSANWKNLSFGGGLISSDVAQDLRQASSASWCTNDDDGRFFFRAGIQQDLRYEAKDLLTVAACRALPDWLGGGEDCARKYRGIPVYPTLLSQTVGFPVQTYSVLSPTQRGNAGYVSRVTASANSVAQQLYQNWDRSRSMLFSTYEIVVYGRVWPCGGGYCRSLTGELRRRVYQDPRLGLVDTVGGAEYQLTVEFEGSRLSSSASRAVAALCGTTAGCGGAPSAPLAAGSIGISGSDDSLQFTGMCQQYNSRHNCLDTTNAALPSMVPTPGRVDSVLTLPGATGAPITTAQRTQALDGERGGPGVPVAPDQYSRYCEHVVDEDSVRRANAPIPDGTPRPTVYRDTVLYHACLTAPTTQATSLDSAGIVQQRTPASVGPNNARCRWVLGALYCPPVKKSTP